MAPVVATEAVVAREAVASPVTAREAGASPVTAREAVVARKDPVVSAAAPVALTRPRGSVALGRLRWRRHRQETAAKWGDGESERRRCAGWVEGFGGEVVAGGKRFFG